MTITGCRFVFRKLQNIYANRMDHMKYTLLIVLIFSLVGHSVSACGDRWFGTNCQYQCHCAKNKKCENNGECQGGEKCDKEWFGPACQYQDLFSQPQVATSLVSATNLTNRNDDTCITNANRNLTVTLNMAYSITWIRLTVTNPDQLQKITLSFNDAESSGTTCNRNITLDRTLDIICDVNVVVNKLSLIGEGVNSMCSLYISGGRNVAVKQTTSQSSTYIENPITYDSSRAVDGNRDSDLSKGSCSHTLQQTASNWNATFSRPQLVNRYILYNRNQLGERLLNFSLSSFNPGNDVVFNYSVPPKMQNIYAVTSPPALVSFVKIFTKVNQFLTLCEVEIYGDSECDSKTFGLDCNKTCHCLNETESCFVATGGCSSGCAIGYYKEDCQSECPSDRWGYNCRNTCNTQCRSNACNSTSGICFGCEDGYMGDSCTRECPVSKWGVNCQLNCSQQCNNQTCSRTNGSCDFGCTAGYIGQMCLDKCAKSTWGQGCSRQCSEHCLDKNCNSINGTCNDGCSVGYLGLNCTETCPLLTYGAHCVHSCSPFCINKTCSKVTGICEGGCIEGFNGDMCKQDPYTDRLGMGIGIGLAISCLIGIVITIMAIIVIKRFKSKKVEKMSLRQAIDVSQTDSTTANSQYDSLSHYQSTEYEEPVALSQQKEQTSHAKPKNPASNFYELSGVNE